jgi:peptide/nickel transport system substrate-binding protein
MHKLFTRIIALVLAVSCVACTRVGNPSDTGARHPWTLPGHVRLGEPDEPDSLNLLFAHTAAADQIATLLYSFVFRFDPKGELIPEIATEVPTYANGGISKDNKTIRLHIRPGMVWADGAPLDARDIRFTWRAVMNDRNTTKSRIYWDDVASMDVPDNNTLIVRLKRPNSAILYGIFGAGGNAFPPLPEHLLGKLPDINRAAFNSAPLSSGPWILKSWTHGASLEFIPNDKYWRGPPKLKQLTWKVIPNTDTLFQEMQTHDIDIYDPVPESQIPQLGKLDGIRVIKRLKSDWRHLEINTRKPMLSDVRVRRAIAEAVDWDRMNATIYHGVNVRATSDIVPDSWAAPTIAQWRFDLADAKALLTAAGWVPGPNGIRVKDGKPLEITISTGTNKPANIEAEVQMQQQLRAAGISLSIKNYAVSLLFAQNGPLYGGTYDLSWSVDTNGPEPDNQGSWSGDAIPPKGANTSFLNDPVITQTTAQALLTFDRAKRKALYAREEQRIHELVPAIFLYWSVDSSAVNSDLKNYRPAEYDMADLWNSYEWDI